MTKYKTIVGHANYEADFDKQLAKFRVACSDGKLEVVKEHFSISGLSLLAVFEYKEKACRTTKKKAVKKTKAA